MSARSLGRHAALSAIAVLLAVPLTSIVTRPDVPGALAALLAAVALLTVVRPRWGVVVAVGLLPLSKAVHAVAGGPLTSTAVAEAIVLVLASAATLRLPRASAGSAEWLRWPAMILGAAVATSAIVDLSILAGVAPNRPFASELWTHLTLTYWTDEAGNWTTVHDGIRWLAVLATAVAIERHLRPFEDARRLATLAWLASAAAATTFTVVRVVEIVSARETAVVQSLVLLLTSARLSVLHPDQNAAGSIFGLLLGAAGVIGVRRRLWWMLGLAVPLFFVGFALAQSRAAIGALVLVVVAHGLWAGRRRGVRLAPAVMAAVLVVTVAGAWMVSSRAHIGAADALGLRVELARTGARMAARFPVWGVGLGDYARTSRRFVPEEGSVFAGFGQAGENAHNNYLQVLVELGIPAGVAFLWLVLPVVGAAWVARTGAGAPEYDGLALGLTVFLVSALFGHPLLIPEVAGMFFVALGLTAAHRAAPGRFEWTGRWLTGAAVAVYAISLAWRVRF